MHLTPPAAQTRERDASGRDEVDRIIAGWARARGDLDTEPLAVFSRIFRLARLLAAARREAFSGVGLEGWEVDMLVALRRRGDDALSTAALMQQSLVTSGTMPSRIDKLVARSLVSKSRSPHDGRAVEVRLRPEGIALVDAAMEALLTAERDLLEPLGEHGRGELARTLRALLLTLEAEDSGGS